jgi:hypothetical protein
MSYYLWRTEKMIAYHFSFDGVKDVKGYITVVANNQNEAMLEAAESIKGDGLDPATLDVEETTVLRTGPDNVPDQYKPTIDATVVQYWNGDYE